MHTSGSQSTKTQKLHLFLSRIKWFCKNFAEVESESETFLQNVFVIIRFSTKLEGPFYLKFCRAFYREHDVEKFRSNPSWSTLQHCCISCSGQARIFKHLRRPGIDSEDSIPPAFVVWQANMTYRIVVPAARLGFDSWAPEKVYKYRLWSHNDRSEALVNLLRGSRDCIPKIEQGQSISQVSCMVFKGLNQGVSKRST
jgi:hypothetical protein